VFVVQAIGLIIAVGLLGRVDVKEFRENAQAAIAAVMQGDVDG
jgi:MFS transporter, BCD family, chlorophyll transporter